MPLKLSLSKDRKEYDSEINFLKNIFSLFVVDQLALDKNIWILTQRSEGALSVDKVEKLPYWRYEQFVSIANEIAEAEKKEREKQEAEQKQSTPNYNPSTYLNQMSSMANKFK